MKLEQVPVEKIHVGERFRKDMGDMQLLAANIAEVGLLQPIGVDSYYELIFGERRLTACQDMLGWKTIPCVVLDLKSILEGQYAENEFHKQLTVSERTAIGRAAERELANRQGGDHKSSAANAALDPKGRTIDLAAKAAEFRSAETYERAKSVVDNGTPEVIAAMDSGKLSITAAAALASQPKAEQSAILTMPKDERTATIRQIRETKADREASEARARDILLFRGLHNAVKCIAEFYEDPHETWAGLSRVNAYSFSGNLDRAIQCLVRIQKAHPNEKRNPEIVAGKH